jgi:hypothetical protein
MGTRHEREGGTTRGCKHIFNGFTKPTITSVREPILTPNIHNASAFTLSLYNFVAR